jgi:imidazolonepropionase-like amidohydrolase
MTTVNAALAMHKEHEFGTIEVGKRADLLLLHSNPLDNIENLKNKSGLMVRGIWLPEEEINKMTGKIKLAFGK